MKDALKTLATGVLVAAACAALPSMAQTQSPSGQAQLAQVHELPQTNVSSPGLPAIRVSYADLDVSSEAGMRTLATRVRSAARHVCQPSRHRPLDELLGCRRHARREAWQQFERNQELARATGNPMVAAIAIRPDAY
ncbi:MAG: UrcA family protein [Brevundimonas sp.]